MKSEDTQNAVSKWRYWTLTKETRKKDTVDLCGPEKRL
jgi:hypothetical protein